LRAGKVEPRVAVGGALLAAALIPLTPPGVPVLAATAALLLAGPLRRASADADDAARP
jgi:hypothetical protein